MSPNHGESGVESATLFVRDITEWKHRVDEFKTEIDALRSKIPGLSSEKGILTGMLASKEQQRTEQAFLYGESERRGLFAI